MRLSPDYRAMCVTINLSIRCKMLFECVLEDDNTPSALPFKQFYGIYYHICQDDRTIIGSDVIYSPSQRP